MAIRRVAVLLCALAATAYGNVALSEFFPYGPNAGDERVPTADDNFVSVPILPGNVFHFFQNSYTEMFLNNNGGVSFLRGAPEYTPTCGPLTTPMIMPYWADVNTMLGGNVYYRQTTDPTLLQKARDETHRAFPGLNTQNINWMFVATWDEVPFFGATASNGTCRGLDARNNFQMALVTDGTISFAMFFYNTMTWTTGTASGGDCNGMNGTPAKSGFDLGDGVNFFTLPGSCTGAIQEVTGTSNVDQEGKWIFRIDESFVDPGVEEQTTTAVPETTQVVPIVEEGECDPNLCELQGHCTSYNACDRTTRRRVSWECSEGLFWNPKKSRKPSRGSHSTTMSPAFATSTHQWASAPAASFAPFNGSWAPVASPATGYSSGGWNNSYFNGTQPAGYYGTQPGGWNNSYYYGEQTGSWNNSYSYPATQPASSSGSPPVYPPAAAPTTEWEYMTSSFAPVESSTFLSEEECHGSCDVWENLPEDVKATYEADEECFPKCYYAALGECSQQYLFHDHNTEKRNIELLECPVDTRDGMNVPLVWVQERESCDFCYNAPSSYPSYPASAPAIPPATAPYPSPATAPYPSPATAPYPSPATAPYPSPATSNGTTGWGWTTTDPQSTVPSVALPGRSLAQTKQWDNSNGTFTAPTGPMPSMPSTGATCCAKYDSALLPAPIFIAVPTGRSLKGNKKNQVMVPNNKGHNFDLKHKGGL